MALFSRFICTSCVVAFAAGAASSAHADSGVSVGFNNTPLLGSVIADADQTTVFRIDDATGLVSVVSGQGVRTSTNSARALVTLSCGSSSSCSSQDVTVKVGPISGTLGRGLALTNFSATMNTAQLRTGSLSGANPLTFRIKPIGKSNSVNFYLGMDFPIAADNSGKPSGISTSNFYVYADFGTSTPNDGSTGTALATVSRALGLSSSGTLNFGKLLRPLTGTGTAVVDSDQGQYHNNNIISLPGSTPSRVVFTAVGDPNKTISISIPHDFPLKRSTGETLTVTVSSNAGSSGNLNNSGSYTFGVGGSINVSTTTLTGVYNGSFAVSISYN